jgi:hypothetical protein
MVVLYISHLILFELPIRPALVPVTEKSGRIKKYPTTIIIRIRNIEKIVLYDLFFKPKMYLIENTNRGAPITDNIAALDSVSSSPVAMIINPITFKIFTTILFFENKTKLLKI